MRTICLLASEYSRFVADAFKDNAAELRKDEETRVSKYAHVQLSLGGSS